MTSCRGLHEDKDKLLSTNEQPHPVDVCQQGMGVLLNVREHQHGMYDIIMTTVSRMRTCRNAAKNIQVFLPVQTYTET